MGMTTDFFKKLPKVFSKMKEALIFYFYQVNVCEINIEYSYNCCNYSLNKYFKISCILE